MKISYHLIVLGGQIEENINNGNSFPFKNAKIGVNVDILFEDDSNIDEVKIELNNLIDSNANFWNAQGNFGIGIKLFMTSFGDNLNLEDDWKYYFPDETIRCKVCAR